MQRFEDESVMPPARSKFPIAAVALCFVLALAPSVGLVVAAEGEAVLSPKGAQRPFRAAHCDAIDLTDSVTLEAWIKPRTMDSQGGRIIDKGTAGTQSGYMLDTFPGNSLRMIVRAAAYEGSVSFPAELSTGGTCDFVPDRKRQSAPRPSEIVAKERRIGIGQSGVLSKAAEALRRTLNRILHRHTCSDTLKRTVFVG
jgi:hypothetical protein